MKRLTILLTALLTAALCAAPALAANRVETLTTDVALRADGSAHVTQVFSADTAEGTEFYVDRMDSGCLTYSRFAVSDENGPYAVLPDGRWDIDASFDEKAGKCGLLEIDGGVELCWGITEYGRHDYTVSYDIGGLAGAYSDADGFNYRFIDPDQSIFPTSASVTVRMEDGTPLTDETCDIWAFGFDGQIQFEDGVIRAWTETPLEGSRYMTVMVRLEKGCLLPERQETGAFQTVVDTALQGSDYDTEEEPITATDVLWMVGSLAAVIGIVLGISRLVKARKKAREKKRLNSVDYFRDLPNGGDLNASYALGSGLGLCTPEHYMAARLLRLVTLGSLEPEADGQDRISLRLLREPHGGDAYDEAFYTFLESAAGGDSVLQERELERFCEDSRRGKALNELLTSCEREGRLTLFRGGSLRSKRCKKAKDLTAEGQRQWRELLGLKRYLLDFSLLAERTVSETVLWQEYMVYAALLGIAEQVLEQVRTLYPQQLSQVERYQRYLHGTNQYNHYLYAAVARQRQAAQAARSGGSGGFASLGGGGGFSGGGSVGTR